MKSSRAVRGAIALLVVAGASFLGVRTVSAVSGTITGNTVPVNLRFVGGATAGAALITLTTVGGDQLLTYCIELNTDTTVGVSYDEGTWTAANVPNINNVRAILQASYPVRSVTQLQTATGIAGLTTQQAIAGTQGAIWHFTDAINLDRTVASQNAGSNIGRLYDFLLGVAANPAPEPAPALTITPATATGTVGTLVGPFTLHITPSTATATLTNDAGAAFTDGGGNPITPTTDGQVFWVRPVTEGTFHINATAEVTVPTGRVFLHPTTPANPAPRQKLVLATSDAVTTTATASFGSTAAPTTTTTTAPAPTTTVATGGPTTTVAPEATTTTVIVEVLPPVPPTTPSTPVAPPGAGVPSNPILPATGSSSSTPGLLIASATLLAGLAIAAIARRRAPT
jgi:TQXA domain-containing protein/LPXTG-motif cell wall-anchored protein